MWPRRTQTLKQPIHLVPSSVRQASVTVKQLKHLLVAIFNSFNHRSLNENSPFLLLVPLRFLTPCLERCGGGGPRLWPLNPAQQDTETQAGSSWRGFGHWGTYVLRPQSEQSDGDPRLDLTAITRRLKRDLKDLSALLVTLGQADKNGWYQGSLLVRSLPECPFQQERRGVSNWHRRVEETCGLPGV